MLELRHLALPWQRRFAERPETRQVDLVSGCEVGDVVTIGIFGRIEDDRVVAKTAGQLVVTEAAGQRVRAVAAGKGIVAGATAGLAPAERERLEIAIQLAFGMLVNALLHDPGPLRLHDPSFEPKIVAALRPYLSAN